MTVYDVTPAIVYTLTGVADYYFNYVVNDEEDLVVVHVALDDTVTTLVYGVDYVVTLLPSGTGTITLGDTSLTGTLSISRSTPRTQEVSWVNNDPLDMVVQENSFDKLTMIMQDIEASRIGLPPGFPVGVEFPLPESERILGWSTDGTTLENYPSYGSFQSLADAAAASAASALSNASSAAASAISASNSATAASTSASNAATSESNAATSEYNAGISAAEALDSRDQALTAEGNAAIWAQDAANCAQAAADSVVDAALVTASNTFEDPDQYFGDSGDLEVNLHFWDNTQAVYSPIEYRAGYGIIDGRLTGAWRVGEADGSMYYLLNSGNYVNMLASNTDGIRWISIRASLDTDLEVSGLIGTITRAGTYSAALQPIYLDSSFQGVAASAAAASTTPVVAMNVHTASDYVLLYGKARNDLWSLTPGLVYLSTTTGGITQTPPSGSGQVVQVIGVAIAANQILFNPQQTLIVLV